MIANVAVSPRDRTREPVSAGTRTLKVLAVVDGTQGTNAVLNQLCDLHECGAALDVVLLNVQPKPQDWRLRGYHLFKREEVEDRLINELGGRVIAVASQRLDAAGIPHRNMIELGETAETVTRLAREEGCDLIMVGQPPPGALWRWLTAKAGVIAGSGAAVAQASLVSVLLAR